MDYELGFRWQYSLWTSTWLSSNGQGPTWTLEEVWTMEVPLSRRSNQVNGPFFNSNILSLFRTRAIVRLGSLFQVPRLGARKLQAAHHPDSSTGNDLILHHLSCCISSSTCTAPLLYLSHPSITHSFVAVVRKLKCVTQYARLFTCRCSLQRVWFEASGFHHTISTGPSLSLLLDILLLSKVTEILWLWFCRTSSFMSSNRSQMEQKLGWTTQSPGSGLSGSSVGLHWASKGPSLAF